MRNIGKNPLPRRRALKVVGVIYCVVAGFIVFWPSPVDAPASGMLFDLGPWLRQHGVPSSFANYNSIEFTANIIMFVPAGFIMAMLLAPRLGWVLLGFVSVGSGVAVSGLIETIQGSFLPARVADPRDIYANSIGTVVGLLCALVVLALRKAGNKDYGQESNS